MPAATETGSVLAAVWSTSYVNDLPDSSFAYIEKGGEKDAEGKTTPRSLRHLPYKDKDGKVDLPHVRNALARLNQTQGIPAGEKAAIRTKLQNALRKENAKAADDLVLRTTNVILADDLGNAVDAALRQRMETDDNGLPTRVHLLRAGTFNTAKYGEVPIAASDLYEMKFNFERGLGMADEGQTGIPIDFAHMSHLEAAGWIHGLDVLTTDDGGTELWGTNVEWSDVGRDALLGKRYKDLSSDFYPAAFGEWADPESGVTAKNVIVGAALTNRPLMTGNKPVIASEIEAEAEREADAIGVKTVIYVNATSEIKETRMNLDQLRVKAAEDLSGAEYKFVAEHQKDLSSEERAKFGFAAPAEEPKPAEQPVVNAAEGVKGTEGVVSIQAADLKAIQDSIAQFADERKADKETISSLQASVKTLEESNKQLGESARETEHKEMQKIVEAAASRGAIKPDRIESYTNRLVAAQGEDREALIADLEALASNPLLASAYGSKETQGSAAMDVEAEIGKKVKEAMAANASLSAFTARQQVLAADPELAERSAQAARAAFGAFDPFKADWTGADHLTNVNADVKDKAFSA